MAECLAVHVLAPPTRSLNWPGVQSLSQQFPESDWIVAQAAVAQYNLRNFDGAQELFEDLIERDPHRVEVRLLPVTCPHVMFPSGLLTNWQSWQAQIQAQLSACQRHLHLC